jgi:hypothetical protein
LTVFTSHKADANTLSDLPFGDTWTDILDDPNYFMSRYSRQSQTGPDRRYRSRIGMADTTCLYAEVYLTWTRFRDRPFNNPEFSGLRHLHRLVCIRHVMSERNPQTTYFSVSALRICSMGAFQDRERTESLRAAEERALEMMANGASLSEVLNDLCGAIDAHDPDIHSMVCLMDGEWLSPCAGPHVPATFKAAITPWKIGPQYRFVRHGRLYETTSDYPGRFERSAMAG